MEIAFHALTYRGCCFACKIAVIFILLGVCFRAEAQPHDPGHPWCHVLVLTHTGEKTSQVWSDRFFEALGAKFDLTGHESKRGESAEDVIQAITLNATDFAILNRNQLQRASGQITDLVTAQELVSKVFGGRGYLIGECCGTGSGANWVLGASGAINSRPSVEEVGRQYLLIVSPRVWEEGYRYKHELAAAAQGAEAVGR